MRKKRQHTGIPVFELEIDKDGQLVNAAQEQSILSFLKGEGSHTTDVVVISHGWNNSEAEARTLYSDFFKNLEKEALVQNGRQITSIALLWPSKKFEDASLIPGGAASTDSNPAADDAIIDRLEDMKGLLLHPGSQALLEQMKSLVPSLNSDDPSTQDQFVALLAKATAPFVDHSQISEEEGSTQLENVDGAAALQRLGQPIGPRVNINAGGGADFGADGGFSGNPALRQGGGAADIGDFFHGIKAGAMRLLNLVTYYVMKDRAGKIGRDTVNPLLHRLQQALAAGGAAKPLFHLVGHSFGGRLVTAIVDGPNKIQVQTLALLQGAYSHNGLSANYDGLGKKGFFSAVVANRKVTGPILITHSKHDSAVGLAYPIASRLNGVDAASIGDANDRFGGMGANGAQHVPVAANIDLLDSGGTYNFGLKDVVIYNLNGDDIITSHGDVARPETAHALAAAMALAGPQVTKPSGPITLGATGR